ncbi:hypothetical protein [Burkholderia anthina]|uniref:hypothetical protein n=1 Tax=Burkholderia anthina TaxID=179879 RepID=UPI000A3E9F8E|nr:hypothetical protein [Burkholderia anthina]
MSEVLSWIKDSAQFFVTNPGAMLSALVMGAVGGFAFASKLAKATIAAKDERINGFEDQLKGSDSTIAELKGRLSDAHKRLGIEPTGPHKYAAMTGQELQRCAKNVAGDLRNIVSAYKEAQSAISQTMTDSVAKLSGEERNLAWQRGVSRSIQAIEELLDTYSRRFQSDVSVLYQELRRRGGTIVGARESTDRIEAYLSNPVNSFGVEELARALESTAETLPI